MNRRRTLMIPLALLVIVGGAWVVLQFQERREAEAAVVQLVADVDRELEKEQADRSELSSLVNRILKVPAHEADPRLRRARARIEWRRGNPDRAWTHLEPLASALSGAEPVDQLLGARLLFELHAASGARQMARQAMALAEDYYRHSDDPEVLLLAWQCAQRTASGADQDRLADELIERHPGTPEARLVAALRDLAGADLATLERLEAEFTAVPLELRLAIAIRLVEGERYSDGLRLLDQLAGEGPALVDVRHCAAIGYFMMGRAAVERQVSAAERERLRSQCQAHVSWLLQHAPADDDRRDVWRNMADG